MTTQEMATEIVKVWLQQKGPMQLDVAKKEIHELYISIVTTINESYNIGDNNEIMRQ